MMAATPPPGVEINNEDRGDEERAAASTLFRVPIDSRLLDTLENLWSGTKDILTGMVLLWIEPIMDRNSLIELSIGLLLLERVSGNIQRHDPKTGMAAEQSSSSSHPSAGGSAEHGSGPSPGMDSLGPNGILLGSPFVAVLGGFALALSCLANAPYETRMFAPPWLRAFLPRHNHLLAGGTSSTMLMYLLLLLFCLESMLMITILMFGCHAITFPEWLEEDIQILSSLMGVWMSSLLTSSLVRYYLYYSIGD